MSLSKSTAIPRLPDLAAAALLLGAAAGAFAQQAPVTRGGGTSIDDRLARIERLLDSQGLFDLMNQIDGLQREVQRLRGQLEQHGYELEQLRNRQRDLFVDIDRRLQRFEGGAGAGTAPAATDPLLSARPGAEEPPLQVLNPAAPAAEPSGAPQAPSLAVETEAAAEQAPPAAADAGTAMAAAGAGSGAALSVPPSTAAGAFDPAAAEAAYRDAFSLLKSGRYDESITAFKNYLAEYPGSEYADNAQYWLGEAYYVTRQFEAAIAEYQKLIQAYPQSSKLTHAQLKLGYSLHELGKLDEAKQQLENLVNAYPGTTTARLAEQRLQQIRVQESR